LPVLGNPAAGSLFRIPGGIGGRLGRKEACCGPAALSHGIPRDRRHDMLKWALIFAIIAIVAAFLGFGGISSAAAGIAKILFFIFLAICLLFVVLGIIAARKIT
jgi:uncharacterized membrane protein YtjA (UPF0391 family)